MIAINTHKFIFILTLSSITILEPIAYDVRQSQICQVLATFGLQGLGVQTLKIQYMGQIL